MNGYDIEKLSKNISQKEKEAIKSIDRESIKKQLGSVDLSAAANKMRSLNLGEAASKLEGMTNDDLIKLVSSNPQIIDKLKKIFK